MTDPSPTTIIRPDFVNLPDLALRSTGGAVLAASDELFAAKEHLILPSAPVFDPDAYDAHGKSYDGWETARHRAPDHDWAVIRLGVAGTVDGIDVDTSFFKGNYPPEVSVEGAGISGYPSAEEVLAADWQPLVPRTPVAGDSHNYFAVDSATRVTHVRLSIHPDGGVARLRVFGRPVPDPRLLENLPVDLVAIANGGTVAACSDEFYSSSAKLIQPGRIRNTGEGWETSRRRGGGNDWVEFALAGAGRVQVVELDTLYFVGNAPQEAQVLGRLGDGEWVPVVPRMRTQPDTLHRIVVRDCPEIDRLRLDVFPDGGLGRVRAFGQLSEAGLEGMRRRWANTLPEAQLRGLLAERGLAEEKAAELLAARPFGPSDPLPEALR